MRKHKIVLTTRHNLSQLINDDVNNNILTKNIMFNHKYPQQILASYKDNPHYHFTTTNELQKFDSKNSNDYPEETYSVNNGRNILDRKRVLFSWKKLKKRSSFSNSPTIANRLSFSGPAKKLALTIKKGYDSLQQLTYALKRSYRSTEAGKAKYNELCEMLEFKGVTVDKSEFVVKKKFHTTHHFPHIPKLAPSVKFKNSSKQYIDNSPIKTVKAVYCSYDSNKSTVTDGYESDVECKEEAADLDKFYKEYNDLNFASNYTIAKLHKRKLTADNYEEFDNLLKLIKCDPPGTPHFNVNTESDLVLSNSKSYLSSNSLVTTSNSDISQEDFE
jgi:hypothetical protein